MGEQFVHRQRPFDRFPHLLLRLVEASDVIPVDVRPLDEDLAQRRRFHFPVRLEEIVARDLESIEHVRWDVVDLDVDFGQDPSERAHGGLLGKRRQVGADVSMGDPRQFLEVDVLRERHTSRVDLEDLEPTVPVRDANLDLPVEATGPTQRGVEGVRAIRRTDYDDLAASLESVHECEQLSDHPTFHLAGDLVPFRGDAVQFVDEDDARRVLFGLFEDVPQVLFALAVELRHDLRSRDGMEVRIRLGGDRLREERLAGPRRSVEEDALRGLDAESFEELRVTQREFDHLPHLADLLAEPADVLVVDLGDLRRFFLRRLLCDLDFRPLLDQDGVRARRERGDDEVELAAHDADAQHVAARDRPTLEDLGHVLLAAHDSDRFRGSEGDLLGRAGERLPEAHLVVDAHAGVPSLHAIHADHAAVRVLGIPATDARRGGLGAQDQDDVPFLELQDLHDLGVDSDDPTTRVRGLCLRDAQKFLATGRHG